MNFIKTRKRYFNLIELLVVINVIAIIAALLLPAISKSRESAKRVNCMSNMKQIGISLRSYSIDWEEFFPNNLNSLAKESYLNDPKIFTCPSTRPAASINADKEILNGSFHYIGDHPDIPSLSEPAAGGNTSMLSDKISNHNDYGNVLFSAGNVKPIAGKKWFNASEIHYTLRELIDP